MPYFKSQILGLILALFLMNSAYGADKFYFGGIIGPGINYFTASREYLEPRHPAKATFAWNVFVGMNLSDLWSVEVGYLNLGFYENSGDGQSICDEQGNCGYPRPIPFERFRTKVTVVNDITPQFFYGDAVLWLFHHDALRFFLKAGLAYNDIQLKSYVNVFPSVDNVGLDIRETVISKNRFAVAPHFAAGYEYQANEHVAIRTEFDYFYKQDMLSIQDQSLQGTLYPMAILFGTRISF